MSKWNLSLLHSSDQCPRRDTHSTGTHNHFMSLIRWLKMKNLPYKRLIHLSLETMDKMISVLLLMKSCMINVVLDQDPTAMVRHIINMVNAENIQGQDAWIQTGLGDRSVNQHIVVEIVLWLVFVHQEDMLIVDLTEQTIHTCSCALNMTQILCVLTDLSAKPMLNLTSNQI